MSRRTRDYEHFGDDVYVHVNGDREEVNDCDDGWNDGWDECDQHEKGNETVSGDGGLRGWDVGQDVVVGPSVL